MNQRSAGRNWSELRRDPDLAGADVFLLCEATGIRSLPKPHGFMAIGNGSTKGLGCPCPEPDGCRRRRYSTAVAFAPSLSRGHRARQGEPLQHVHPSRPGSWTAAKVVIGGIPVTAIALYGLNDEPYVDSVRRSLSEFARILGDEQYSQYLVLGGTSTSLPARHRARDRTLVTKCSRRSRRTGSSTVWPAPCREIGTTTPSDGPTWTTADAGSVKRVSRSECA